MGVKRGGLVFFLLAVISIDSSVCCAQDGASLSQAPISPVVQVDQDATLHWGPRTIPFPRYASQASRDAYMRLINSAINSDQPTSTREYIAWAAKRVQDLFAREKATALNSFRK